MRTINGASKDNIALIRLKENIFVVFIFQRPVEYMVFQREGFVSLPAWCGVTINALRILVCCFFIFVDLGCLDELECNWK